MPRYILVEKGSYYIMKLYAPKYYKDFICIADKCKHSCCIGWEIDIDENSMDVYSSLDGIYSDEIRESIENTYPPHFRLTSNDRCPHLDERGLCRIICTRGDAYLCDICREHPRFYNHVGEGLEVGIGMSCEEACRIILTSDSCFDIVELGETEDEIPESVTEGGFEPIKCRDTVYSILNNSSLEYSEKLEAVYSAFGVSPSLLSDAEWKDTISSLEYLDDSHKLHFSLYSSDIRSPKEYENILLRALTYFVYRHCAKAYDYNDFQASLGMCLFLERLLASVLKSKEFCSIEYILECARVISEEIEYSEDNTEMIKTEFLIRG